LSHFTHEMVSLICVDALDKKGYVLSITADGKFKKCDPGETPVAIAFKSTKSLIDETPQANVPVAGIFFGIAQVYARIPAGGDTINPGDIVVVNQTAGYDGTVIKFVEKDTTTTWATSYDASNAETITDEIIAASRYSRFIVGTSLDKLEAKAAEEVKGLIRVVLHMGRR